MLSRKLFFGFVISWNFISTKCSNYISWMVLWFTSFLASVHENTISSSPVRELLKLFIFVSWLFVYFFGVYSAPEQRVAAETEQTETVFVLYALDACSANKFPPNSISPTSLGSKTKEQRENLVFTQCHLIYSLVWNNILYFFSFLPSLFSLLLSALEADDGVQGQPSYRAAAKKWKRNENDANRAQDELFIKLNECYGCSELLGKTDSKSSIK